MKKRIVIFASGSGTNTQNVIQYFQSNSTAEVVLVLSNKENAQVIERARNLGVRAESFNKTELQDPEVVLKTLQNAKPDLIVLAGFLLKFPDHILQAFPDQVINIHPALLPKYGGKGMYGHHVHQAVYDHQEKETGITIHFVNEQYDEGGIIFQEKVGLDPNDSVATIAKKVHELEYKWLPKIIEQLLSSESSKSTSE
ncbi:MAG: phosphoribosylglycinamide formyltransferase [Flavobacteriaceae bacterium]|nr:phosphoribosylglycinamide formyltransferase [Flavobacteriaceae bacterium]